MRQEAVLRRIHARETRLQDLQYVSMGDQQEVTSGQRAILTGHTSAVEAVAIAPDGADDHEIP